MEKTFEWDMRSRSMINDSTTTLDEYIFVRLTTTDNTCFNITTRATVPMYGVTQVAINPGDTGAVAPCGTGAISRLKMGSTAYTSRELTSTPVMICANANSLGVRATTSTCWVGARALSTWAASDIIAVDLYPVRRAFG